MSGRVYFIGAGPGSADLLTVRAARLLSAADVVLHDGLVSPEVLGMAGRRARIIHVGKRCGNHSLTQEALNAMLVYAAEGHAAVVRLKSGDPSIFGRLGEEMDALRAAGIGFEIVPGITAAVAAAAAAQVSLTDRRFASQVVFTTASRAGGEHNSYRQPANATVVVYMPGRDYERLASQLVDSGYAPDTPVSVVSCAGSKSESKISTTLGNLPIVSPAAPSVLIVGEVARRRGVLPEEQGMAHELAAVGL